MAVLVDLGDRENPTLAQDPLDRVRCVAGILGMCGNLTLALPEVAIGDSQQSNPITALELGMVGHDFGQ